METPIVDFVDHYRKKKMTRFHMPGHKGHVFFGWEPYDITEIKGADVLHSGSMLHSGGGIIAQSEANTSRLFETGATHFSTEGSSLCIKAMLAVLMMEKEKKQFPVFWPGCKKEQIQIEKVVKRSYLLAGRNVHRSMVDACALLDLDLQFIQGQEAGTICTVHITPEDVRNMLERQGDPPLAVYLTSPDYLGNILDIGGIAGICMEYGVPLVVDNAHGAYLHFYQKKHPIDLGAAMCCDSAHKTFPVLTGGAYLHIHKDYLDRFEPYVRQALTLFGSTSPSYLILQSLDLCNRYLAEGYKERLKICIEKVEQVKKQLIQRGIFVVRGEPLKIVIAADGPEHTGEEAADELRKYKIECEYADKDYVVLMAAPENSDEDYQRLLSWAEHSVIRKQKSTRELSCSSLEIQHLTGEHAERLDFSTEQVLSIREAVLGQSEVVPAGQAVGRICAAQTVSCPPAIPIAISGERITEQMVLMFLKYGIGEIAVVREGRDCVNR